jgi:hypothetical protein
MRSFPLIFMCELSLYARMFDIHVYNENGRAISHYFQLQTSETSAKI